MQISTYCGSMTATELSKHVSQPKPCEVCRRDFGEFRMPFRVRGEAHKFGSRFRRRRRARISSNVSPRCAVKKRTQYRVHLGGGSYHLSESIENARGFCEEVRKRTGQILSIEVRK